MCFFLFRGPRMQKSIYFKDLDEDNLMEIIDLELEKVYERVRKIEFDVEVDDTLKKHIISIGTDTRFGARILKRTVQKWVDDYITDKILSDNPEKN